uniref:DUF4005 domain-containing protein n=1 Tax=Ananas comosus var. bracteatus TaxID=296719 RepID=A0A6V7PH67_ANACO|nr:unnamed protein product [Ananas comosus var. bracteatus]
MGKSPAKWIKTLLFGKKSARSHSTKGRNSSLQKAGDDKCHIGGKEPASAENSPVISEPVLVSAHNNAAIPSLEKEAPSYLHGDGADISAVNQDVDKQSVSGIDESKDPERLREEQAAIKAQAAFRGYLARRAFRALKGIIRLQALIRGHLVRRQAVATLCAMHAIVKLQAVVRGRIVRHSSIALEVSTMFLPQKTLNAKPLDTWKGRFSSNKFVLRLLSSVAVTKALQILYDEKDPNSVFSWLERWTITRFWKTIPPPKKNVESKLHTKRPNYAMETESGKSKRVIRKNPVESDQLNGNLEADKVKRNPRKFSSSPAESAPESPQTELEKVKRNLRKVSNLMKEDSDHPKVESEKPSQTIQEVSSSINDTSIPEKSNGDLLKEKKESTPSPETKPEVENIWKSVTEDVLFGAATDVSLEVEIQPLQSIENEENAMVITNGELSSKEEQQLPSSESQKTRRRRSSIVTKLDYPENGVTNSPVLPSYMATTESAKAKLRGQISPRFGSDSGDKSGITRRHSLPSSNGKMNSYSPRTQRPGQVSGKGGIKGDRSMLSSRDGSAERPIQVEWRR